jgi:hypothetical protein
MVYKKRTRKFKKRRTIKTSTRRKLKRYNRSYKNKAVGGVGDNKFLIRIPACSYLEPMAWPNHFGCRETEQEKIIELSVGTFIDRFGGNTGYYFGAMNPSGKPATFDERSLPLERQFPNMPQTTKNECQQEFYARINNGEGWAGHEIIYNVYKVIKPFKVKTCTIAPAFEHKGMGVQYRLFEGSIVGPEQNSIDPKTDIPTNEGTTMLAKVPNVQELIVMNYIKSTSVDSLPKF